MKKVIITIGTATEAFDPDPHQAVADILAGLLDKFQATGEIKAGLLADSNGNTVGKVEIEK